jgi:hypothetical protein
MKTSVPGPTISAAFLAMLAAHAPVAAGPIDRRCLDDLTRNGPPAWKDVAAFIKDIAVDFQQRRVDTQEGDKPSVTHNDADRSLCWSRSASRRLLERRDVGTGRRMLTVVNPRYRFQVTRKGDRGPFRLESGKRFSPGSPQTYDINEKQYGNLLEDGMTIQFLTLGEILGDRAFRLTRAEYAPDGRAMVEWHYLGTENRIRSRHAGGDYWAELDPKRSWQMLRGGVRIPATGEDWTKEVTYQPADGHVAFPETAKITSYTPRNKYRIKVVFTLGKPGACRRPEAEYELPYYGIAESALGYPDASPWPRVLGIGAGVLGLGGGLFAASRIRRGRAESEL